MNYETSVHAESGEYSSSKLDGERQGTGKRKLWIALVILALCIAAVAAAYLLVTGGEPAGAADDREDQGAAITVVSPGRATIAGEIVASGTLAARREMPVGIAGEGGRVVTVYVDAGSWVKQGQVLASIDRSVQNQQAASAKTAYVKTSFSIESTSP